MRSTTDGLESGLDFPLVSKTQSCWIRVGALLDGVSLKPLQNANVVYNSTQILFAGAAGQTPARSFLKLGQHRPDLDLPDHTMLPGLIEAHAHLFLDGDELDPERRKQQQGQPPAEMLTAAKRRLANLLHSGVTAVRDAGDKFGVGLALSRLAEDRGHAGLPYIDSPGAAIHLRGRYGGFMAEPIEDYLSARECALSRIDAGASRIKLLVSGIIDFQAGHVTKEPQMSAEEVAHLVAVAREHGKQTFAHASGADGIANAIAGGVDSVEHGYFVTDDQLVRMRDEEVAWTPTLAPVQRQIDHARRLGWNDSTVSNLQRILERHSESLRRAHELGVIILAGSDAGSYGVGHGAGLLFELQLLEKAGLPPLAVLKAATGNPASRLALGARTGCLKPGYRSDFILTQFSPLTSVSNLDRDKWVVYRGQVHSGVGSRASEPRVGQD